MGRDKALIRVGDTTLVERAASALRAAGAEPVLIIGGDAAPLEAFGLEPVPDRWPGEGPLGGIVTALHSVPTDVVVILSCDLTDASAIAVRTVVGALGTSDVAVPVVEGRPQWLHAAWRRQTALPVLEDAFANGERAPRSAAGRLRVTRLLDGDPCWFHDADRPDDLPDGAR
ncbi:MAG: NTP transferase domain-containing protein [Actinobacteria bacterium]|nr:molybdenum cofactor guanylyltransferase [Actinomycetota bacterium]NIS31722.1 molybdenum cofactor guanylyltransferase [Actinomycetota bacterium]NIT95841.1 molybdenum cofactor guanylyltransferase [Actinomycetota bacterium]NIU66826.1 molybdenum cofactor guanylyltransferase [Actinomycetota bacterium]NIV56014.1 NTP transferase domain-containing protein [Actinomycetota bacterium]